MRYRQIISETINVSDVVQDCIADFGQSPKAINNGWCTGFAGKLSRELGPGAEIVSTTGHEGAFPGHSVVLYNGLYYDAETPNGVREVCDLDYCKRIKSNKRSFDNRPALRSWPSSIIGVGLIRVLQRSGVKISPAAIKRIKRFSFYTLSRIPIACLNLLERPSDAARTAEFAALQTASPPIVFDEANESIIDGLHRAIEADQAGRTHVLGYVGAAGDEL